MCSLKTEAMSIPKFMPPLHCHFLAAQLPYLPLITSCQGHQSRGKAEVVPV